MTLPEHGSYELELQGQILIQRAAGAWNFETAKRCCAEYKALAETINASPWGVVVNLLNWELGTPDIWSEIDAVNRWADQNNEKFEAVICTNDIQVMLLERTYDNFSKVETCFCDSEQQAIDWLISKGIRGC